MPSRKARGSTPFARLLRRYETTPTRCTACGHVDRTGNWSSRTDGRRIIYNHVCPSCGADRDHVFRRP